MNRVRSRPEQAARQVLEQARAEYGALGEPWDPYRIDVELVATLLFGIGVQRVRDLKVGERGYAAFLNGDARLVAVEDQHHPHRQRFSIAHEIGHFTMHYLPSPSSGAVFACSSSDMEVSRPGAIDQRNKHQRREYEANLFAGELLMPEQAVLAMYRVTGGRIPALARHFQVSPKAMEIRLMRLPLPFPSANH